MILKMNLRIINNCAGTDPGLPTAGTDPGRQCLIGAKILILKVARIMSGNNLFW